MRKNNPFTLTFGKYPSKYISRYEDIQMILDTFESENPPSQAFLIEGIRGSGKTVLMTVSEKELESRGDWIIIDLNSTQELFHEFAIRLSAKCRKLDSAIKAGFNVSVAGIGLGYNGKDKEDDLIMIEEMLSKLKKKKVLITIDEAMNNNSMKRFASEFQLWLRKDYPVFLLMTGLYENIYSIQNDPSLTFLLRTPKISLTPLSMLQVSKQYNGVFDNAEISDKMAILSKGYAFAFQALGYLYYEYGEECTFDEIVAKYDDMLDDFVYKKIWSSLSDADKKIILAFNKDKMKTKDICDMAGINKNSFTRFKERLIKKGLIDNSQHGYISLNLPRFLEISQRYGLFEK